MKLIESLTHLDRICGRSYLRRIFVAARNGLLRILGVRLFSALIGADHSLSEALRLKGTRGRRAAKGTRLRPVMVFSPFYWPVHLAWETVMERTAREAGHPTVMVGCGGLFFVCDAMVYEKHRGATCATCRFFQGKHFDLLGGVPPVRPGDLLDVRSVRREARMLVTGLDNGALKELRVDGWPVGEWAQASVMRHLRTAGPGAGDEEVHRGFVASTIVALRAFTAILDRFNPARVVVLNGKFFAQRTLLEVSRKRGIEVITYERGNVKGTLVFGRNRPAVPFDLRNLWEQRQAKPLDLEANRKLDRYLRSRIKVGNAQVAFFHDPIGNMTEIRRVLRLDERPLDVLFTNLVWDSAVAGEDVLYPSMFDWIREAVEEAARTRNRLLVIRAHPAEVKVWWQKTRATVGGYLDEVFPQLPENVRFVPPGCEIDSYALMTAAETGLVYTSTAGLEMVIQGKPVIVAGRANYRGMGFTLDPDSPETFRAMMARRGRLTVSDQERERARRFAYLVYFVASVSVPWVEEIGELGYRFKVDSLTALPPPLPFLSGVPDRIMSDSSRTAPCPPRASAV